MKYCCLNVISVPVGNVVVIGVAEVSCSGGGNGSVAGSVCVEGA